MLFSLAGGNGKGGSEHALTHAPLCERLPAMGALERQVLQVGRLVHAQVVLSIELLAAHVALVHRHGVGGVLLLHITREG